MAAGKGSRKVGRQKAKKLRNGSAISQYVRGRIDFNQYVKNGGLTSPSGRTKARNRVH